LALTNVIADALYAIRDRDEESITLFRMYDDMVMCSRFSYGKEHHSVLATNHIPKIDE
jgi:hypothetical protein